MAYEKSNTDGHGGGQPRATVTVAGGIANQRPGEYFCQLIVALDTHGNQRRVELPEAPRFRVVERGHMDYEGPEVLSIGPLE